MKNALGLISSILILLDLLAIALGAPAPDFYLRPLILILLFLYGLALKPGSKLTSILILIGVLAAAIVEIQQMLGAPLGLVVVATSMYYFSYALSFALRGGRPKGVKALAPFVAMAIITSIFFYWLEPYGLLRWPAVLYTVVLVILTGLGLRPLAEGDQSKAARFMAAAVVLLAFSDTLRAITIFKGHFRGDELLIMATYFGGQFSIIRSLIKEN